MKQILTSKPHAYQISRTVHLPLPAQYTASNRSATRTTRPRQNTSFHSDHSCVFHSIPYIDYVSSVDESRSLFPRLSSPTAIRAESPIPDSTRPVDFPLCMGKTALSNEPPASIIHPCNNPRPPLEFLFVLWQCKELPAALGRRHIRTHGNNPYCCVIGGFSKVRVWSSGTSFLPVRNAPI